ncbi:SAM-dependent methyltransferase [Actinokineospora soli]|uniref:SAM-dependent methyltransferase n=1 Tax=Actinokineospora soli TaxID=1048753 RepID=A0ABW2TST7_9PSEU
MGAGPGAADLLTLRGAKRIADADLVLYASGAVDPVWLREHTGAELVDCARLSPDEIAEHYRRLAAKRGAAVRLVGGDPALAPGCASRSTCAGASASTSRSCRASRRSPPPPRRRCWRRARSTRSR